MKKIRLGILGAGNMALGHARNVLAGSCPDFELTAIAEQNAERVAWCKENLSADVAYFETCEQMIGSGLIEACLIAVPHYEHPKYAILCMQHGIQVLVEKPAGVYTKQVREMNEEAQKHDAVFAMMFNQRTDPLYRKLRELVHSGKYGRIRRVNWIITSWYRPQAYYDSGAWRGTWSGEGGGVLLNQAPHQLDLLQWICGLPKTVQAHMKFGQWHDVEIEDDVTAYMEYENGATGVFITSTGDSCGTNRLEIQMDGAKLVADNGKLTVWEFEMSEPEFTKINTAPFGSVKAQMLEPETDDDYPGHVGVINAWGGAILRGESLVAEGQEGINGLMLSNAMHLSAWLGKPVTLPVDEDLFYEELMKRVATSHRKVTGKTVFADTKDTYKGTK